MNILLTVKANGITPTGIQALSRRINKIMPARFSCGEDGMPIANSDGTYNVTCWDKAFLPLLHTQLTANRFEIIREWNDD